ncbi:hypothetical protein AAWM_09855 [Aspergillus awamori]|uniref:Uncharacterized protein n=1 Tax=Aspergillus awamori TaxID=105351 RepID=A0A401L663_ASPAW|nr:hypothetical protein AAWM_09855 [Aspergillus awamori]
MKLTTALGVFALIATANAAVTGYCTPGFNYCSGVLDDVGDNDAAISDALRRSGHSNVIQWQGLWVYYLFHCNDDQSLTVVQECQSGCQNNGKGNTDICRG